MSDAEFSHIVDLGRMGEGQRRLVADATERAALAARFGLVRIDRLEADIALEAEGTTVAAHGRMTADIVQSCAISGDDLPVHIEEPLAIRFVPEGTHRPDEEVELSAEECDEIEYSGSAFDLGEAVAQSLALAIDPFATGPNADAARAAAGIVGEDAAGPFAALAALKKRE